MIRNFRAVLFPGCHCGSVHVEKLRGLMERSDVSGFSVTYPRKVLIPRQQKPTWGTLAHYRDAAIAEICHDSTRYPGTRYLLVGHSTGGILAQSVADTLGEKQVAGLVLLNTVLPRPETPRYDWGKFANGGTAVSQRAYAPLFLNLLIDKIFPGFLANGCIATEKLIRNIFANEQTEDFQRNLQTSLLGESPLVYRELGFPHRGGLITQDYPNRLRGIPALVLGGAEDRMFDWRASVALASAMGTRARFEKLSGDHWSIDGRHLAETADHIARFTASLA